MQFLIYVRYAYALRMLSFLPENSCFTTRYHIYVMVFPYSSSGEKEKEEEETLTKIIIFEKKNGVPRKDPWCKMQRNEQQKNKTKRNGSKVNGIRFSCFKQMHFILRFSKAFEWLVWYHETVICERKKNRLGVCI